MLQYRFSIDAVADLEAISDYLRDRNPDAADRIISSIFAAIKRACLFPASNPLVEDSSTVPGTRKLVEAHYRYVIYYYVVEQTLIVLRVFHGRRQRT